MTCRRRAARRSRRQRRRSRGGARPPGRRVRRTPRPPPGRCRATRPSPVPPVRHAGDPATAYIMRTGGGDAAPGRPRPVSPYTDQMDRLPVLPYRRRGDPGHRGPRDRHHARVPRHHPKAPVHVLVIPKAHHSDVATLAAGGPGAGRPRSSPTAAAVAEDEGLRHGFRVIFNTGHTAARRSSTSTRTSSVASRSARCSPGWLTAAAPSGYERIGGPPGPGRGGGYRRCRSALHRADRPMWTFTVGDDGTEPRSGRHPVPDRLDHQDVHRGPGDAVP